MLFDPYKEMSQISSCLWNNHQIKNGIKLKIKGGHIMYAENKAKVKVHRQLSNLKEEKI